MRQILIVATAGLLATAATALTIEEIDVNADGAVTYDEFMAAFPTESEETFTTIDANADGVLDPDELAAAADAGVLPAEPG